MIQIHRRLFWMLLLLATAITTRAWEGSGTSSDPYQITSEDDWRQISTQPSAFFKLMQDITVYTSPASDPSFAFSGTFDGNGHTITAQINDISDYTALFYYVAGGTIKNLHVNGTVTGGNYSSGLVGLFAKPSSTIENCRVSATITGNSNCTAGFVGQSNSSSLTIKGCLFDGKLVTTGSGSTVGAPFVANFASGEARATIEDCAELGTYTGFSQTAFTASSTTLTRIYHRQNWSVGTRVYSISAGGENMAIDFGEPSDYYSVSDMGFYGNTGFAHNNVRYAPEGTAVTFTATGEQGPMEGVLTSSGTISFSNGVFTLTLGASDATITPFNLQGNGTQASPFLIRNSANWEALAAHVNSGESSPGSYYLLTDDISVKSTIGTSSHPFVGIFDGGGHTIDCLIFKTSGTAAPFAYVSNATIEHLHVTGRLSGGLHTSGLVGYTVSGTNVISDCKVSAEIIGQVQDSKIVVGGILGHGKSSSVTISGCMFDGSVSAMNSVDFSYAGAIVGWCDSSSGILVKNCIEGAHSETGEAYSGWIRHAGMNYDVYGNAKAVPTQNSYTLHQNWGEVKRGYKIVSLSDDLVVDFGLNDTYPTSGISASAVGLMVDTTFYAGSGDVVSFNAPVPAGYSNIYCSTENYERIGSSCQLTMPASDVYIAPTRSWPGAGTESAPFLIENESDWMQLALDVAYGEDYSYEGNYFLLANDIDIYLPVGSAEKPFRGTFDGGGHTLNANLRGGDLTAPFVYLKDATIAHLHVAGQVRGSMHIAGLAGKVDGQTVVEDCRVSANIVSSTSHAGGFIGHARESSTTLNGCIFDGEVFCSGSSTSYAGIFFGWSNNASGLALNDCYAKGTCVANNVNLSWKNGNTAACGTVSNTYHDGSYSLGKRGYSITTSNPVLKLDFLEEAVYPTASIEAVVNNTGGPAGLIYDGLPIAGAGTEVRFELAVSDDFDFKQLTASSGELRSVGGGVYYLTMPSQNVVVSANISSLTELEGSGTEEDPYLIGSTVDWIKLSVDVQSGLRYSDKVFRLTKDVDCDGVSVGSADHAFCGTFDGDGHKLTYSVGTKMNPVATAAAPFVNVFGATLRHLYTDGTIYTNAKYAGGIISSVGGSDRTQLYDCHSSVNIFSSINGEGMHGGLVGIVYSNADTLVIERSSFKGALLINKGANTTSCGGFVGRAESPVTITDGVFDPQGWNYYDAIFNGATFASMSNYDNLTLNGCYATMQLHNKRQGTTVICELTMPAGCTYEFQSEPEVTIDGKAYYKSGFMVQLTAPEGAAFNYWVDNNGCFISDPWSRDGVHQIKDLNGPVLLGISTNAMPSPETERTLWGVTYRYLSRRDYHFYVSDEDRVAKGWTFESDDSDANMIIKNSEGKASEITAVTGYKESDYDDDGVQIHNDLVGTFRNHTHLGLIAPHAFRNSTGLQTMYFKDTDANNYNTLHDFDFFIDQGAFEGCTNFKELKMMQYTTKGDNHWEGLKPAQTFFVADNAFTNCPNLKISAQAEQYQNYLSSPIWKMHQSRFIIYGATTDDFTVNGVKYHWYRDVATEDNAVKNDESGKADMMKRLQFWNADYQQFNAASLLDTKDDCNVYYTSIVGVDNSDIDKAGGVMRIYNDPGSYYNYKTINLQADAIAGNTHVKSIEFWQTNGNGENSYSDLKMVIPNGAFKGCSNLEELNMFYYIEDGDDRWVALGPKDVIPGNNIFGEITPEELQKLGENVTQAQLAGYGRVPANFKILVATELYNDFINDPNWLPYIFYIEPTEFSPTKTGWMSDFTTDGITYGTMTSPEGIMQTSQVVSQDVSWWTAPRIAIEVALTIASLGSWKAASPALSEATAAASEATAATVALETAENWGARFGAIAKMSVENTVAETRSVLEQLAGKVATEAGLIVDNTIRYQLQYWKILTAEGLFMHPSGLSDVALLSAAGLLKNGFSSSIVSHTAVQAAKQAVVKSYLSAIPAYVMGATAAATSLSGMLAAQYWGGSGTYNGDLLNKGMRENILANIHQVGLVGGGYVITTPQKNLVYHTYVKSIDPSKTEATIYGGHWQGTNYSSTTVTCKPDAFQNNTKLQKVNFHDSKNCTSNASMPMLFTIPDSAFVGCTALTEFSTLLKTDGNGTRAMGPENFILGGDSIFAGLDSLQFHIIIDPLRKEDFLNSESWKPLKRFFQYESAAPAGKYKEYGAEYAYAYEQNTIKKENKVKGHLIEHTIVIGPDDDFIKGHQGAVKLCNDIGTYNNYQLDYIMPKAFKGNKLVRSVSFTDLYGFGAIGDCYTDFQVHIGDSAFVDCTNLANLDLLYMVTDGFNSLDPLTPQMITIGKGVFDNTNARLKMMPQQVAWFEADTTWAAYKDRFMPCVVKLTDPGITKALKPMAYYDPANTGSDDATWNDYVDFARIGGAGFDWLDGKFTAQKDNIYSFADFRWFESVGMRGVEKSWFEGCSKMGNIVLPKTIQYIRDRAFYGCSKLTEIELPENLAWVYKDAFAGCTSLNTIIVRNPEPAILDGDVFDKHEGLKIYVPADKVDAFKTHWSSYAPYIVGDDTYHINKVVTVTAVGQLASKLGLTLVKEKSKVHYIQGPYAKYDSLTVIGPLNGEDLAVIRHLAGADAYDSDPTDGCLRYLNLWDADIKKDSENAYNGNWHDEKITDDNTVPQYLFENCCAVETVILPKSVTYIEENTFEDAKGLKRVAVGRKTTEYQCDILQSLSGIEELVFLTEKHATSTHSDPWEAPILMAWTLPSQLGDYLGDPGLTRQAQRVASPFADENVMWTLASHGQFFPSEYLQLENVDNIFCNDTSIKEFDDFRQFEKVRNLGNTFRGMTALTAVTLPDSLKSISAEAFSGCTALATIRVSCDSVPALAADAFASQVNALGDEFRILVPKDLCKLYREKWAQYADYINADTRSYSEYDIITVTVTEPNTLAKELGLTVSVDTHTLGSNGGNTYFVNSLKGDYSKIHRLKVIGPISSGDLSVLRHLAGYTPWSDCRNIMGPLEYLDLYDADLRYTNYDCASDEYYSFLAAEKGVMEKDVDNQLPPYAFLKAYNLRTLILPRTCKEVMNRAIQECEGLEVLVIGDDCETFNWNALDDDAMLTRLYILTTKKLTITTENFIWRNLCNNYNPTFDAFYVRPSLLEVYRTDEAYVGSSWQRTNNISKGEFNDDESFAAFAAHAAATLDDLVIVDDVSGWFDHHTGVRDLTQLGYTSVDSLHAADIQKLTQLEKVMLPKTLTVIEDDVFANSPELRYVDMLVCDSTMMVDDIRARGVAALGIDSLKTLVYLPKEYGEAKGVNIVIDNGGHMRAETFRLIDGKDYCVPYAFDTEHVQNSRLLADSGVKYTVCLPYTMPVPAGAKVYSLTGRDGNTLIFSQVMDKIKPFEPYLVVIGSEESAVGLSADVAQTIPTSTGTYGHQVDGVGYVMRGTLSQISNSEAASYGAYILQKDDKWHPVTEGNENVYIPAFRAYLLPSGTGGGAKTLGMQFIDADPTAVPEVVDGERRAVTDDAWYDLQGRKVNISNVRRGVYIHNGRRVVVK